MKKINFKKIKIAKLSDEEKRSINTGNMKEASKIPPCLKDTKIQCPPWENDTINCGG